MENLLQNPALIWFLIGLVLILGEMIIPGLVILFFGIGAWITSLLCGFLEVPLNVQLIVFLSSSVFSLFLLRKYLSRKFFGKKDGETTDIDDEFIGRTARTLSEFSDGTGKVDFKGTQWQARCETPVQAGQLVKIVSKESITLYVKPINS